jgi:hypothetical protein
MMATHDSRTRQVCILLVVTGLLAAACGERTALLPSVSHARDPLISGTLSYTARVFATVFATALLLAALPVRVESAACPSGVEIEASLTSMLSTASGVAGHDVAKVERLDGKLRVELSDDKSVIIAERVLDGHGSCAELAQLAAIVIASWESDVHPEFVRPHAEPPAPPPPTFAPNGAYEVSLGATLSQAGKPAAGGSLGTAWFPRGTGFGLSLLVAGGMSRTLDLGVGQARWRHWTGNPEIAWRYWRAGLAVDGHGGLALGWLETSGADFSENRSSTTFSLAVTAGIRSAWWFSRHIAAWIDLRGLYFTRGEVVYSTPAGGEAEVPRLEGIVSLGLALGRAPAFR